MHTNIQRSDCTHGQHHLPGMPCQMELAKLLLVPRRFTKHRAGQLFVLNGVPVQNTDLDMVRDLLIAASKYRLTNLLQDCEKVLATHLQVGPIPFLSG